MDERLTQSGLFPHPDRAYNNAAFPESLLFGQKILELPDLVWTASPETYIRPGLQPFFLQYGDRDDIVPY